MFVSFEEIQPHIAMSCAKVLTDAKTFSAINIECSKIIRDKTGQAIPDELSSRADDADWVILPAAWIIQYIASNQVTNKSPEFDKRVREQYADALKLLDAHPLRAVENGSPKFYTVGAIEGMYE